VEHKACGNFHVYTYFLRDEDGDSDICWKSTTIIGAINLFINNARDDIRQSMQLERERKLGLEQDLEDLNAARDRGGSTALWEWILRQGSIL
ncbi:MAG: hypothetical protein GTN93_34595, partial [Anaerolineae bacterium]|nr:hypothetical protein [Anaerolineae bacterium]